MNVTSSILRGLGVLRARIAASCGSPQGRARCLLHGLAWIGIVAAALHEFWPMLRDFSTYGFHDWDVATAQRYITRVSLMEYHELPWWHPWLCGGFPAFGFAEGAPNLLSPFLPFYLFADVRTAIRMEILGSTLIGLAGAYVLAGRFTRSIALRALVAVLAFLNGRWTLQAATGHGWHLVFGFMPWVLWFFDRALEPGRIRQALWAAALLALMAYMGGLYPLPYTALALVLYSVLMVLFSRTARPLYALALAGPVSLGLAAPKLWAIMDNMGRVPRVIESREVIGVAELWVMLTDRAQQYGSRPVMTPAYNWHEWGIYIGILPVALLGIGLFFARGPRPDALRMMGLLYLILGFGAFRPDAPWGLLHRLPPFSSLHVPSRFHFPMVLFLALAFAAWAAKVVDRWIRVNPWFDLLLLAPVALLAMDLVKIAHRPIEQAFWMRAPEKIERLELFAHTTKPSVTYLRPDWAPPVLLPMMANAGVIECYGVPLSLAAGARGADAPDYKGRSYFTQETGKAEVVEWSPNRALVRFEQATPGSLLVYNMNWDPGWQANGEPALDYQRIVATKVANEQGTVEFTYRPRTLGRSLLVCLLTLLGVTLVPAWWRSRFRPRAASASGD